MSQKHQRYEKKCRQRAHKIMFLLRGLRLEGATSPDEIAAEFNKRKIPPPQDQTSWSAELVIHMETWAEKLLAREKKQQERAIIAARKFLGTIYEIQVASKIPGPVKDNAVAFVLNKLSFPLPSGHTCWSADLVKVQMSWAIETVRRTQLQAARSTHMVGKSWGNPS